MGVAVTESLEKDTVALPADGRDWGLGELRFRSLRRSRLPGVRDT